MRTYKYTCEACEKNRPAKKIRAIEVPLFDEGEPIYGLRREYKYCSDSPTCKAMAKMTKTNLEARL